jgi:hypothetical protein
VPNRVFEIFSMIVSILCGRVALEASLSIVGRIPLAIAILATAWVTVLHAGVPAQLSGTQTEQVVTLVPRTSPYLVTGTYDVPPGCQLIIEAGTKLLFTKDAALHIRGTLSIKGSKEAPVELAGKATGGGLLAGHSDQQVRLNPNQLRPYLGSAEWDFPECVQTFDREYRYGMSLGFSWVNMAAGRSRR